MMQSVPGASRFAATRVAKTSCTNGTPTLSAMPMPALPDMASFAVPPGTYLPQTRQRSSSLFSNMWL